MKHSSRSTDLYEFPSLIDDIELKLIRSPPRSLRDDVGPIDELAASIAEKGLLQPILVRPVNGGFEVVAGCRRLAACRSIGMRKLLCHVMELDEKEAFETALIENVQHQTMNPVEEARAFLDYIDRYGYGSESDLARKIGKSEQYVSQRIRFLSLPADVIEKVSRRLVTFSSATELIGMDESAQKRIAIRAMKEGMTSRSVREAAREAKDLEDPFLSPSPESCDRRHHKILSKCIALFRTNLIRLDNIIENVDHDWVLKEMLVSHRTLLNQQIDELIRLRGKLDRAVITY